MRYNGKECSYRLDLDNRCHENDRKEMSHCYFCKRRIFIAPKNQSLQWWMDGVDHCSTKHYSVIQLRGFIVIFGVPLILLLCCWDEQIIMLPLFRSRFVFVMMIPWRVSRVLVLGSGVVYELFCFFSFLAMLSTIRNVENIAKIRFSKINRLQ